MRKKTAPGDRRVRAGKQSMSGDPGQERTAQKLARERVSGLPCVFTELRDERLNAAEAHLVA